MLANAGITRAAVLAAVLVGAAGAVADGVQATGLAREQGIEFNGCDNAPDGAE